MDGILKKRFATAASTLRIEIYNLKGQQVKTQSLRKAQPRAL